MIISPSRNFIFIHLEKCGGTSVESALDPFLRWDDLILGSTEFGERLQALYNERYGRSNDVLWKHSTAQDIYNFLTPEGWNEFAKIAVVRNPIDIVMSLYHFSETAIKYHVGRINRGVWIENLRTGNIPDVFPFTEGYVIEYIKSKIDDTGIDGFVRGVLDKNFNFVQPQFNRLQVNKKIDIQLMIDLSQLDLRWQKILDVAGISNEVFLGNLNTSEKSEVTMSEKSVKEIKKHFAIDFQELPRYTGVKW
jgi:hypothetical protein